MILITPGPVFQQVKINRPWKSLASITLMKSTRKNPKVNNPNKTQTKINFKISSNPLKSLIKITVLMMHFKRLNNILLYFPIPASFLSKKANFLKMYQINMKLWPIFINNLIGETGYLINNKMESHWSIKSMTLWIWLL